MKKLLFILLLTMPCFGQTVYNQAFAPVVSCNAVAATGACTSYLLPVIQGFFPTVYTWQTVYTGTPTAITVNLEGSIDGTTWATVDSSTSTAGEIRFVSGKAARFLRCNISAYTVNGSTAKCQFIASR